MRSRSITVAAMASLTVCFATNAQAQGVAKASFVDVQGRSVGSAEFWQDAPNAVVLRLAVTGLPEGWHGLHIHAIGKCEGPDFTSAGGHYNPGARKHGHRTGDGAHAGDLPNVYAGADGKVTAEFIVHGVSLGAGANSLFDADGSGLVIHAKADDGKTDPTGDSGARIACAVVVR